MNECIQLHPISHISWMPTAITATDGHINVGRTVTGAALTDGLSLLVGGSRTKGKVMITYTRTPQWIAEQAQKKIAFFCQRNS
jgi:hypothetical protein